MFVDADDPVKYSLLTLTNDGDRARTLSVFAYNDWVLGPPREGPAGQITTTYDAARGTILARKAYSGTERGVRRHDPRVNYTVDSDSRLSESRSCCQSGDSNEGFFHEKLLQN